MSIAARGMGKGGGPLATMGMGKVQRFTGEVVYRIRNFIVHITAYLNMRVNR